MPTTPDGGMAASDLDIGIGARCYGESFCAAWKGWCGNGTCRQFCAVVDYPRCTRGFDVSMLQIDTNNAVCLCVPH